MKNLFRFVSVLTLVVVLFGSAQAITWFPQEFTCPIDNEKNIFLVWGSYGSYVYAEPSKYQWLFFPWTYSEAYYICKKCHLATNLGDFDKLPKDKLPAIRRILAGVKVSKQFKDYQELPVSERMEIMEKVYSVLDRDEHWWETFYRLKGYHYGAEGKAAEAAEARRQSLALVQKELGNEKSEMSKKLLLYISAAMKHFLADDKGALEDLNKALNTKFQEKGVTAEDAKKSENGLNERIKDYIEKIKSKDQKPRLAEKSAA
jgi:hypothetical protein